MSKNYCRSEENYLRQNQFECKRQGKAIRIFNDKSPIIETRGRISHDGNARLHYILFSNEFGKVQLNSVIVTLCRWRSQKS